MVTYEKLPSLRKHQRYFNMMQRCYDEEWQERNTKAYKDKTVCQEWRDNKRSYFSWLDDNYYVVDGNTMDVDSDILVPGNKIYSPTTCLVVPHRINALWETLKIGKTSIRQLDVTGKFKVRVIDRGELITYECDSYNEAVDMFCDIKTAIIEELADELKDQIPGYVYKAMLDTDVRSLNEEYKI